MVIQMAIETPAEQRCGVCREVKPAAAFSLNRSSRSGLQHTCYECQRDRRYGLSFGEYDRRMKEQQGVCAICHKTCPRKMKLSVDHDHETGRVRGLLCQNCNAALGMFSHDSARLAQAISYITGVD